MPIVRITASGPNLHLHDADGRTFTAHAGVNGGFWYVGGGASIGDPGGGTIPGGAGGGFRLKPAPPESFTGLYWDGSTVTYNSIQMRHAYNIISAALQIDGITKPMVIAALMCAMVESVLWMYANSNVPSSLNYPHDLVGSDHDSVGLFQQRPSIPWGSVANLMSHSYSTRAFIGGPTDPNSGNPPGLLDISPAWNTRASLGAAVQAVQGSAHPGRYQTVEGTATAMFEAMTEPIASGGSGGIINPFPGKYDASDPFGGYWGGKRDYPHTGSDWNGIAAGTPIPALGAGTVVYVGYTGGNGNVVSVKLRDFPLYYAYLHMDGRASVNVGQVVNTGDILGRVGNTGSNSGGTHLHVTLSDDSTAYIGGGNKIDPYAWIVSHGGAP